MRHEVEGKKCVKMRKSVTGHSIEPGFFNKPYAFDKFYDVFYLQ